MKELIQKTELERHFRLIQSGIGFLDASNSLKIKIWTGETLAAVAVGNFARQLGKLGG